MLLTGAVLSNLSFRLLMGCLTSNATQGMVAVPNQAPGSVKSVESYTDPCKTLIPIKIDQRGVTLAYLLHSQIRRPGFA